MNKLSTHYIIVLQNCYLTPFIQKRIFKKIKINFVTSPYIFNQCTHKLSLLQDTQNICITYRNNI